LRISTEPLDQPAASDRVQARKD